MRELAWRSAKEEEEVGLGPGPLELQPSWAKHTENSGPKALGSIL